MAIKPSSAKAKGRKHQQWVRDKILELFPELESDDVRSTGMGQGGKTFSCHPPLGNSFPTLSSARP